MWFSLAINLVNNKMLVDVNGDLKALENLIFIPNNIMVKDFTLDKESLDYGASTAKLNSIPAAFRVAKITPAKVGYFVTLWRRCLDRKIKPYNIECEAKLFIIIVRDGINSGHFIFSKDVLLNYGVISNNTSQGKLGIRLYPSWCVTESKQARKTQYWQLKYFIDHSNSFNVENNIVERLYSCVIK